jgi:hypothetical protein
MRNSRYDPDIAGGDPNPCRLTRTGNGASTVASCGTVTYATNSRPA